MQRVGMSSIHDAKPRKNTSDNKKDANCAIRVQNAMFFRNQGNDF